MVLVLAGAAAWWVSLDSPIEASVLSRALTWLALSCSRSRSRSRSRRVVVWVESCRKVDFVFGAYREIRGGLKKG